MKTLKRTYQLSPEAVERLEALSRETGLKFSDIIDRVLTGKPVGARRLEDKLTRGDLRK